MYVLEHGFLLWVPDSPEQAEGTHAAVLKIQLFARKHGCDYVLLDSDGPEEVELSTFDWEHGDVEYTLLDSAQVRAVVQSGQKEQKALTPEEIHKLVSKHSADCGCLDCDLRDALQAGLDAIDTTDCDMDEDGNELEKEDLDDPPEKHECSKTRALDLMGAALTKLLERRACCE